MAKRNEPDPASRPDADNPEWTREEMQRAPPALAVIEERFGAPAADALRRGWGRPAKPNRKVNQTLRLDPDVLEAYQRDGQGWQTRINNVLRQHMPGTPHGGRQPD